MPKFKYIKEHLFQILAVFTIGFPFVGYKILAGVVIHRLYDNAAADIIALLFVVWGLIDLMLNAICLHAVCRFALSLGSSDRDCSALWTALRSKYGISAPS